MTRKWPTSAAEMRKPRHVSKQLADGSTRHYYYAFRGGPLFWDCDGRPVDHTNPPAGFWQARDAAMAIERETPPARTISELADAMELDAKYRALAASTRATYAIYIKRIREEFGADDVLAFGTRKIRADVIEWRDKYADVPRAADYGVATLSRIIGHAVETGILDVNHISGINQLHHADRSGIIWTPAELARFLNGASEIEANILTHARYTGLRRKDLAEITRAADRGTHLSYMTSKKRGRVEVIIPIVPEYRAHLDRPQPGTVQSLNLITNRRGQAFTANGIGQAVAKRCAKLKIAKHLHDMRGTFATELMHAGYNDREIGEVLDWSEKRVSLIRRRYISREAVIKAGIARLSDARNKSGTGNQGGNQPQKKA